MQQRARHVPWTLLKKLQLTCVWCIY